MSARDDLLARPGPGPVPTRFMSWADRTSWMALALLGLAGALSWLTYRWGMTQFGGFDHSLMIDLAWRLHLGQRPHADFILTLPPFYCWITGDAFRWFGVRWSSLVLVNSMWVGIFFLWASWLMGRLPLFRSPGVSRDVLRVAGALYLALGFGGLHGFWWHNTTAAGLACLLVLSCGALASSDQVPKRLVFSALVSATCLAASKPNTAFPALVVAFGSLAGAPRKRRLALTLLLLSLGTCLGLVWATGYSPLATLKAYRSVSGRATSFDPIRAGALGQLLGLSSLQYWLALVAPLLFVSPGGPARRRNPSLLLLGLGTWVIGAYALVTNMEQFHTSFGLLFAGSVLLASAAGLEEDAGTGRWTFLPVFVEPAALRAAGAVAAVLCMSAAGWTGARRMRVEGIGPGAFYQDPDAFPLTRIRGGFFDGLRASPNLLATLQAMDQVKALAQGKDQIWFGPRLQFGYAYLGIPSPTGFPMWWHPGTSHGFDIQGEIVRRWRSERFPLALYLPNDFTWYPDSLVQAHISDYGLVVLPSGLWLLRRKATAGAAQG